MKLATSTGDFSFLPTAEERVKHIADAGFRYLDMSFYDSHEIAPFLEPDWREKAAALREYAESLGCSFVQAHSPGGNPLNPDEAERMVEITARSVEVCELLGIPRTVAHAGFSPELSWDSPDGFPKGKEGFFRRNRAFYERLFPVMERCGVEVLVENSTKANMGAMYYLNDGASMREFLDWVNHPLLNACWDTGHANIEGHQYADIVALGNRLTALHVNDNRGRMDEHLPPYTGSLCLGEVVEALRAIGYSGAFTFECGSLPIHTGHWLVPKRQWKDDDPLEEPPLFVHDRVEALLYEIGCCVLETAGLSD